MTLKTRNPAAWADFLEGQRRRRLVEGMDAAAARLGVVERLVAAGAPRPGRLALQLDRARRRVAYYTAAAQRAGLIR